MAGDLVPRKAELDVAREAFLSGRDPAGAVRSEILTSWRRSARAGASPETPVLPYIPELDADAALYVAARPVLDRLADRLDSTRTAMLLADREARIIGRWVGDPSLLAKMDRSDSTPGFALREEVCGTNGLGSVIEEGHTFSVVGAEHFAERFVQYACHGAPIRHPVTGRIEGVLTFMCRAEESGPLMPAFAEEAATGIEQRILDGASRRERLLLDAFITAGRRARRAVLAINEQTIIASPGASRLLEGIDHASLWEALGNTVLTRAASSGVLTGDQDRRLSVTARPVFDGERVVGAVAEVSRVASAEEEGPAALVRGPHPQQRLLRHLGGHSRAWTHAMTIAGRALGSSHPALIVGEPGVGKLEVALALHELAGPGGEPHVLNAALAPVDGFAVWLGRLRARFGTPGTLILTHLETLTGPEALAVAALLDGHEGATPRLIGTVTRRPGDLPPTGPHLDRLAVHRIELPPLRERGEDVPELVHRMLRRRGDERLRLASEAMQAFVRASWPGNVRQLDLVLRGLAVDHGPGEVGLYDLPVEVVDSPRRARTHLERLELEAIVAAMRKAGGDKTLAAADLGLSRSTLYRKLREFHIDLDRTAF
ncbi:MAG TPA: helix-turn-helix domain-containing protein [Streptosporangiaceae bacterium]|nr:helix-turn-helix domain-containing protein [Streptosporangiaceae bacterium]